MADGLRITGGVAVGRVMRAKVQDGVRPTSARLREAIFSMLGQDLTGERFLDAFGGSGIMALEAASRGAVALVVEQRARVARPIADAASQLGLAVEVRVGDVLRLAPELGVFHVVFADPPYAELTDATVEALAPCVGGVLLIEAPASWQPRAWPPGLVLVDARSAGSTRLWRVVRSA